MSRKEKLLRLQVLLPKIGTPPEQYGLEGTDSQGPLLGRPRASERALIAPGNFQVGSNELKRLLLDHQWRTDQLLLGRTLIFLFFFFPVLTLGDLAGREVGAEAVGRFIWCWRCRGEHRGRCRLYFNNQTRVLSQACGGRAARASPWVFCRRPICIWRRSQPATHLPGQLLHPEMD